MVSRPPHRREKRLVTNQLDPGFEFFDPGAKFFAEGCRHDNAEAVGLVRHGFIFRRE
jgi:hypothetical protein